MGEYTIPVTSELPFAYCKDCPFCDLNINTNFIYGSDGTLIRSVTVFCNEHDKCRRLVKYLKENISNE